jgi:hypothetical protein
MYRLISQATVKSDWMRLAALEPKWMAIDT